MKKKVIAYFMHEHEEVLIHNASDIKEQTQSFAICEIEDNDIDDLRAKGVIVQELDKVPEEPKTKSDQPKNFMKGRDKEEAEAVFRRRLLTFSSDTQYPYESVYYLIQLEGPLIDNYRKAIEEGGAKIEEYIHENRYRVYANGAQIEDIQNLEFIVGLKQMNESDTGVVGVTDIESGDSERIMLTYDIRLYREDDAYGFINWLEQKNCTILKKGRRKFRLEIEQDSPLFREIAQKTDIVASVEEHFPPKLFNDRAKSIIGVHTQNAGLFLNNLGFDGSTQVVAVADTGLDDQHPDFNHRIIRSDALGRPGDPSDPHGHGTHVAGSVLGDGGASQGAYAGVAPGAQLYFQSLMDSNGGLGGIPMDLEDLFEPAYQLGARIHNNSWGASTKSTYTINSNEVDEYVRKRPEMLVVIAAGNEGTAQGPVHSNQGFVDWLSIGSPASSKNAITVGASRSDRTSGGLSTLVYGNAWPTVFPDQPISGDTVSGDPERIAGFSSRGPCDDKRIKPDVVAPGTDIISTRSSAAGPGSFWGVVTGNNHYAYMGGTSMACPIVAGCAALIREYYELKEGYTTPSAALIKGTLINGTRRLVGPDAIADIALLPNYHQGFGIVDMPNTVPNDQNTNLRLEFLDGTRDGLHFYQTGQRHRFVFKADANDEIRICMTYSDTPGRSVQNNINIMVEYVEDGTNQTEKYMGNHDYRQLPGNLHIPDPDNNIEIVRFTTKNKGECMIQVFAGNLLHLDQECSLVVTGKTINNFKTY